MPEEVPILSADHRVRFASSSALSAALPSLRSGTLVVRGGALEKGQTVEVKLGVGAAEPVAGTRVSVVAVMGDRMILRMLDLPDALFASLETAAGLPANRTPRTSVLDATRNVLASVGDRVARIGLAFRADDSPDDAIPRILLHPSGHVEFGSAALLVGKVDAMLRDAFVDVEWSGPHSPLWDKRVVFLFARGHPAVVDLQADVLMLNLPNVRLVFSDREALQAALLGLKEGVVMTTEPSSGMQHLPFIDASLSVHFDSPPAVMALMPMLFRLGVMRVRWTGSARPPSGIVDVQMVLDVLRERVQLRGWFSAIQDGLVTFTLDAKEDGLAGLNQWLTQVRERTTTKLRAIKGPRG